MDALVSSAPRVTIANEASDTLQSSVVSLSVNQPINGMSHMELLLVNWGQTSSRPEPGYLFNDIQLGDEIQIEMGLGSQTHIFSGDITAIEEVYGAGAPQLVVLAEDKLHRLARIRRSQSHEEMSADDVINNLISEAGMSGNINVSSLVDTFNQINESHLAYLLRLGRRYGINARMVDDRLRMQAEEDSPSPVEIDMQRDAISARITADLNHQPASCEQRGWNLGSNRDVHGQSQGLSGAGRTAASLLGELNWDGADTTPCPFPTATNQASAYAQAHFERRAKRFVTGQIKLSGNPQLSAGAQVQLNNGSTRFNGDYRIEQALHRFDRNNGYETHLQLSRAVIEGDS